MPPAARAVFLQDAVYRRLEFFGLRCDRQRPKILDADEGLVRGNGHDFQFVDLVELGRFGFRRSGHAGELVVHAEIILEGDGGEGLVLALDLHAFFGFDGLVQAVRPAAAGHLAAGKFVDDHHFAVFHHVIHVVFDRACARAGA